jgi:hypothetical protein
MSTRWASDRGIRGQVRIIFGICAFILVVTALAMLAARDPGDGTKAEHLAARFHHRFDYSRWYGEARAKLQGVQACLRDAGYGDQDRAGDLGVEPIERGIGNTLEDGNGIDLSTGVVTRGPRFHYIGSPFYLIAIAPTPRQLGEWDFFTTFNQEGQIKFDKDVRGKVELVVGVPRTGSPSNDTRLEAAVRKGRTIASCAFSARSTAG